MNLNDIVEVHLTKEGSKQYFEFHQQFGIHVEKDIKTLKTELWNIKSIFGPKMYNGGPELIENNEITIIHEN